MKYCPKCQRSYPVTKSLCPEDGELLTLKDLYGLTGRVINDKYRIESLVTVGGMSAVYRARQIGVERRVAFKILLPHLALQNQSLLGLFEREARTAGRLTHENIATVHDAGRTNDEMAYIVMEWLEGKTLENEFQEHTQLSFKRIAYLLRQLAAALDTAHTHGIIHRDLKPSNIMIIPRPDGRDLVKVLDFGLAKITNERSEMEVSSALGTPHYASPEQFRIGEEIDGRSDIYSLGVILYRMLTGQLPFEAGSMHELIRLHLLELPAPLRHLRPDAPPEIEYLVTRMLAKTPHYRPTSGVEVVEAYEQAIQQQAGIMLNRDLPAQNSANGLADSFTNGPSNGQTNPLPTLPSVIGTGNFTGSLSFSQPSVWGVRAASCLSGEAGEQPVISPVTSPSGNQGDKRAEPPLGIPSPAAQYALPRGATFVSVNTSNSSRPQNSRPRVTPAPPATLNLPAVAVSNQLKVSPLIRMQVGHARKFVLWLIAALLIGSAIFYLFYARQTKLDGKDTAWVRTQLRDEQAFDWQAQAATTGCRHEAAPLWCQAIELTQQHGMKELSASDALSIGVSYVLAKQSQAARSILDEALALDNFAYFSVLSALPGRPLSYPLAPLGVVAGRGLEWRAGGEPRTLRAFLHVVAKADADLPVLVVAKKEFAALKI